MYKIYWRTRASISVPRACKARALPIELVPRAFDKWYFSINTKWVNDSSGIRTHAGIAH